MSEGTIPENGTVAPQPLAQALLELWAPVPQFRTLVDAVRKQERAIFVQGLTAGAVGYVLAALRQQLRRPLLWIVPDPRRADQAATELQTWTACRIAQLPALDALSLAGAADLGVQAAQRLGVLGNWLAGEIDVLIVTAAAARQRLAPPGIFDDAWIRLDWDTRIEPDDLQARLVDLGYERTATVTRPGEFARRGGLLDVYPPTEREPLRIEWFDDEIDSIRRFDPDDQLTIENVDQVVIGPATDLVWSRIDAEAAAAQIEADLAQALARLETHARDAAQRLQAGVREHLDALKTRRPFAASLRYLPYLFPDTATVFDYLPPQGLCVVEQPNALVKQWQAQERLEQEHVTHLLESGQLLPRQAEAAGWPLDTLGARLARVQALYVMALPTSVLSIAPDRTVRFATAEPPAFRAQWGMVADALRTWETSLRRIVLSLATPARLEAFADLLSEHGYALEPPFTALYGRLPEPGGLAVLPAALPQGFEAGDVGVILLSEADLTGRAVRRPQRRRRTTDGGARLRDYTDLNPGDYVVHVHHGIARYLGVQTMTVQDVKRDYLLLQFQGGDRVYVPTDQIDLVQKYIGADAREPRLSKLGGAEWSRAKARVRASVRELAAELLELYAAREAAEGYAFPPDDLLQQQFEQAFPYEETEDQLRAIAEIKRDMERPRPMDRLLCGDVGYGKTEVAMRAAFKAVMGGKQVAVLVPTTVLAQQHYRTFVERFRDTPVTIDVLSRFRSPREQAATLTGLRRGTIDIVIATHRLVQRDIGFKDLGLLIIDEEHRFGVEQKERLKRLKRNVDVLSLTATPIPRTLHMALSGLRDLSVIETPPEERVPVQTFVLEHDDAVILEAIRRELARGGQVFYLHNRVQTIQAVAQRLRSQLPGVRIGVAHGQMDEALLERVMLDFIDGQYDVLVCTTIIESGLDIGNVNTLIVEDADRLGLAQMYQLRGRIGRSDRSAYAYFTYRPQKLLTEDAEKRLQAIKDFSDFGDGLKLALRDLEIRGAGNLLGAEQHGFLSAVGFDLYTQLLAEAIQELRDETPAPRIRPSVELVWDAYIPDEYVPDPRSKIDLYKQIDAATSRAALAELRDAMTDRFGELPLPVRNLLLAADYRLRAEELGVLSISQEGTTLTFTLAGTPAERQAQLEELGRRPGWQLRVRNGLPLLSARMKDRSRDQIRQTIKQAFAALAPSRMKVADPVTN